jgi:hypothetical protein
MTKRIKQTTEAEAAEQAKRDADGKVKSVEQ